MRALIMACSGLAGLMLTTSPASAQPRVNHRLDASFEQADKNKDGFLDAEELARAFRGPSAKVIVDKIGVSRELHPDHAFMDAWDADKDGKISKSEFERYEAKVIADSRTATNRGRIYTRGGRPGYRAAPRHVVGYRGRAYGTNPYVNQVRYVQRGLLQQRQAYANLVRYGVYSPTIRGGYRGAMTHHHGRRR